MKLGIVGSRRRNSEEDFILLSLKVLELLEKYDIEEIVSGGCPQGGDRFAEIIADTLHIPITIYKPDCPKNCPKWVWVKAAFDRNSKIAERSDILVALVAKDRTGGTEDTISKFKKTLILLK